MTDAEMAPSSLERRDMRRLIFVLGDSRTGTLSLNNFFLQHKIPAIHYFVAQAGCTSPLHLHEKENERKMFEFIQSSDYEAYSDYPTRYFYRQLVERFPDAFFILTVRESTDRWEKSMRSFFGKFGIEQEIESLRASHERINDDVRRLLSGPGYKFLEICIDGDNAANSKALSGFLGLSDEIVLPRDNASDSIELGIMSRRHRLYSRNEGRVLESVEDTLSPSKTLIAESGWMFLANDTNEFLRVQFGRKTWAEDERLRACSTMRQRMSALRDRGVLYKKFIVPEKSIVYREYLPRVLHDPEPILSRPAEMMAADNAEFISYLGPYLLDARSYGLLFFRGDTHPNWLGSWFIYRFIVEHLARNGLSIHRKPFRFSDLSPSIASYDGDLSVQARPELRREFDSVWGFLAGRNAFEVTIKLELDEALKYARRVAVPDEYLAWFPTRETIVYERPDKGGLTAVVFRDSTLDHCIEYLAQHFSRVVFVWHQGQVYDEVIEKEKPDVVLHVMAERFVFSYRDFPAIATINGSSGFANEDI